MSKFSIPLDRLAAKYKGRLETVVRKATLDMFRSVVLKSPVDTGRFKANWNVSYGAPNASTGPREDKTPLGEADGATMAVLLQTKRLPVGGIVYLANGLPYARRLEYGWSKQAPAGMVRLSVVEFKNRFG